MVFSPDGQTLASGSFDQTIRLWSVATRKEIRRLEGHQNWVECVAFSPDGKTLASGATYPDTSIRLWEAATGKEIRRLEGHRGTVGSVAFSPDGKTLASGSSDQTIRLWEAATGKEIRCIGKPEEDEAHPQSVLVAFSPDGKILASTEQTSIRLWETATGKEIRRLGGQGWVGSVAFSPDGKSLASAGANTILVWDVIRFGRPRQPGNRDLHKIWTTLVGDDASKAYDDIADLADMPQQAVPFLQKQLRQKQPPDPQRLARLIADLDSKQFDVREQATSELEKVGAAAAPAMRKAIADKPALEVRQRMEQLLEKLKILTPEQLRELRTVQILERAGTKEAKQFLETLAKGMEDSRLTQEAKAALARLAKRR